MTFMVILWVPVIVLLWRTIVSKQNWPVRIGAATAATLTAVGSVTAPWVNFTDVSDYRVEGVRDWIALAACCVGPAYLYLWSRKHRGRGRSKTISIIAAIIGAVPIIAALTLYVLYTE